MEPFIEKRASTLLERGKAAVEVGDYFTAFHEFKASAYVLRTSAALTNWGSMEHCLGDSPRAIELCREAIALDPDWGSPYNNIGSYLVAMHRQDEAIAWFKRALGTTRFDGHRHVPHINLGKTYLARGRHREALAHAEAALAMDPGSDEAIEMTRTIGKLVAQESNKC